MFMYFYPFHTLSTFPFKFNLKDHHQYHYYYYYYYRYY